TGLNKPDGVAVDGPGNLFVTDANNNRVMWAAAPRPTPAPPWQATSSTEWVGPFTGLQTPRGAAVIAGQMFYIVDSGNSRVVTRRGGTNAPEVLHFTGLNNPNGLAVDTFNNVWVADAGNNRVLLLKAGSNSTQTVLSFNGLNNPQGVAVYSSDVYVTDT